MKKIFIIIMLAVAGALGAWAQKAEVESFEVAPMDLTAQKYARKDLHGEKCAVVKVRVIADGVAFQGNLIGEPVEKPGEYWVYLTQGTKQVQILSRSFLPYMFFFPEPLRGGVTYELTMIAPQPGGTPKAEVANYLVLKVKPATARVTVDGKERSVTAGVATVRLDRGTHTYRVEASGYAPQEGSVLMAGQRLTQSVVLVSTISTLTVTAATPGTEIYVNDSRKGVDRWSGQLLPDTYVVEGRLNGYRPYSRSVTLAESQDESVTIPALEHLTGTLNVEYTPVDATIAIDGKDVGVTPNVFTDLTAGTHYVTISAPGYTPVTRTVSISESAPVTLTGALSQAAAKPMVQTPAPSPASSVSDPYAADVELTKQYQVYNNTISKKYGYKLNGNVVIPAKFDSAFPFSDGLALVEYGGKWGYVDKDGNFAIPAKYSGAGNFSEGLAGVEINGKWGKIDKRGNVVIPAIYESTSEFKDGKCRVTLNGRMFNVDRNGNEIGSSAPAAPTTIGPSRAYAADIALTTEYEWFKDSSTGKFGFKHNGKVVIPAQYTATNGFYDGLAAVEYKGKWGFIDKDGKWVLEPIYDGAWKFGDGLAAVKQDGKWGAIDLKGNWVISPQFKYAFRFCEGLAYLKVNDKWGFIDPSGKLVIPAIYDDAWAFTDGKARVKLNGREFYIDRNGNEIGGNAKPASSASTTNADPAKYEPFEDPATKKYGYKCNGKIVIPAKYDHAFSFSNGLASVKLNGKWGKINANDTMVIPAKFDDSREFSEGLAAVCLNGKWGYVDGTGKLVIPAVYSYAYSFENGKAHVELNGRTFHIDRSGKEIK